MRYEDSWKKVRRRMKVYRIELMIVDHDELGPDEIREELENARFANYCMRPCVASIEARDIGEWKDDHPLNSGGTWRAEFNRLFTAEKQKGCECWYYDGDGDPEPMSSVIGDDGDSEAASNVTIQQEDIECDHPPARALEPPAKRGFGFNG